MTRKPNVDGEVNKDNDKKVNDEISKEIKDEVIEFNGPLEFKGSLTEDNKR